MTSPGGPFVVASETMDSTGLALFLLSMFVGGVTSGLAGFAFGLVVSAVWLHIMTPVETATLIAGYSLISQGYGVWQLRHAFEWRAVAPYIIGGVVGAPLGAELLAHISPAAMRTAIGVFLIVYSVYGLARPAFWPGRVGVATEAGVGFLNGLIGGLTGLVGVVIAAWCQVRGFARDVQRCIFQPVTFAAGAISLASLAVAGAVTAQTVKLYLLGIPVLLVGLWTGFKLYGRLDDAAFRTVILVLLLLSGLVLLAPVFGL
jgi:uncharacterized membrane protein YfcA